MNRFQRITDNESPQIAEDFFIAHAVIRDSIFLRQIGGVTVAETI